jgi:hypothetical protein
MITLNGILKNSGLVKKKKDDVEIEKLKVIVESETPSRVAGEMSDIEMHTFFFDPSEKTKLPKSNGEKIAVVVRPYSFKGDFGVSYSAVAIA